jgi:hypothetical protein
MKLRPEEISGKELTEDTTLEINEEKRIEDLTETVKSLTDKASWIKNVQITNKKEERERFKEARTSNENFEPDFNHRKLEKPEPVLNLLEQAKNASEEINTKDLDKYDAKEITAEDLQEFFTDIFRELELYTRLSAEIEDEESWREYSESIWPMIDRETYENSLDKLREINSQESELEENLTSEELKEMFEDEVERLGMEYSVEIRNVGGCFNIPEEETVVVADGSEEEKRKYSRKEAEMLTKHELFHAVRAYNGYKAGEDSGFPPILGIHTPFYDQTEEGGALYREKKTGTNYTEKDFDYHLRLVAAYKIAQSDNYIQDFQEIVEELIDLGGSIDRSFYLVARNREALRHHIYLNGVREWEDKDNLSSLMIGKVNSEYAETFRREVEAGGMLKDPEVSAEKVFETGF